MAPNLSAPLDVILLPVTLPTTLFFLTLHVTPMSLLPQDVVSKFPDGLPRLDPVEDMGVTDPALLAAADKVQQLEGQLVKNPGRCAGEAGGAT
jgi:ATP-dependent RNA helicase DOB1